MKKISHFLFTLLLLAPVSVFSQGFIGLGVGFSFPAGGTYDFIDQPGWRGCHLEAGGFFTDHLSAGAAFSWYGYYKSYPLQTYENINGTGITITGKQLRYENVYPLMLKVRYYFPANDSGFMFYAGGAVGAVFATRLQDFGVYSESDHTAQFGFYPEAGISYWFTGRFAICLDGRYYYSLKSAALPSHSGISVNLGLVWKFGTRNFTFMD